VLGELYHPGIVRLLDDGTAGGLPWLAMELLSGETVCARIAALRRQTAPLGPPTNAHAAEALRIAAQLCRALDYVHERGLVHRDVKPANVFVARDGRVTLLDFGLACVSQVCAPDLRAAELCVGTMEYAAPEQLRGEPVDARADIFSVGCVLYELVTGRRPGEDDGAGDCETGDDTQPGWRPVNTARLPARPPALSSALPPALHALLTSMLAERREDRPSGAGRIAGKLERLAAQLAPEC
jgi:serine/threonine protein kinase